jgi:segregation and condensation protein A
LLEPGHFVAFTTLFDGRSNVAQLVVTFLAILELTRESLLELAQAEPFAPIYVQRKGDPAFALEGESEA